MKELNTKHDNSHMKDFFRNERSTWNTIHDLIEWMKAEDIKYFQNQFSQFQTLGVRDKLDDQAF